MKIWRMKEKCSHCPFSTEGPGLNLRLGLGRNRWSQITGALLDGNHFVCHKTGDETGDGSNLMCAGAIAFQESRGASSNLQRIMERLDYFSEQGMI